MCHNKRPKRNKVFKELARWGKSSVDWYFECFTPLNY
ncbi:transposase [Trichodesmium erythraeum]|nr:hypothetical protein [Trichodesmium erythraeum GBRTRLIN201]